MDDQKRARQQATLARLERFSRFTDSSIRIPFTRFELGAEALIGLVPVIGDAAGLVLSGYVLLEAQRAGVSGATKRRMLRNMLVDFVGGLLPVVGDAFDAIFKANAAIPAWCVRTCSSSWGPRSRGDFPGEPWWVFRFCSA